MNIKYNGQRGSSKYMGVTWNKRLKKWNSSIGIKYNRFHCGTFKTEKIAHIAYLYAKENIHLYNGCAKEFRNALGF